MMFLIWVLVEPHEAVDCECNVWTRSDSDIECRSHFLLVEECTWWICFRRGQEEFILVHGGIRHASFCAYSILVSNLLYEGGLGQLKLLLAMVSQDMYSEKPLQLANRV